MTEDTTTTEDSPQTVVSHANYSRSDDEQGEYLVTFDPHVPTDTARDILSDAGHEVLEQLVIPHSSEGTVYATNAGDDGDDPDSLVTHPSVSSVVPNVGVRVATAPEGFDPEDPDSAVPTTLSEVASIVSVDGTPGNGEGLTVSVVDSGIDTSHPVFDDHEGEAIGVDLTGNNAPLEDAVGHGTAVGGLIVQLAPAVDLVSIRVFGDRGRTTGRRMIAAYQWLLSHTDEVDLANLSLGFSRTVPRLNQLHDRMVRTGIRGVVAAGNSGEASGTPATATRGFSVGSITEDGEVSDFSSYNPGEATVPEVMAPGQTVKLPDPGTRMGQSELVKGPWTVASGTSFSAPITTGLLARTMGYDGDDSLPTEEGIAEAYISTASDIPDTPEDGSGVIQQAEAFRTVHPSWKSGDGNSGNDGDSGSSDPSPEQPTESPEQPSDDSGNKDSSNCPDTDMPDNNDSEKRGPSEGTSWEVTIERIDDGDSMGVRFPDGSTDTLRLLGVDTPETGGWNYPKEFEGIPDKSAGWNWLADWGQKADKFATRKLAGETVYIEVDSEADRRGGYDRLLTYLYYTPEKDTCYNRQLLSGGYARLYESDFSKRHLYEKTEQEARDNNIGLWSFGKDSGDPDQPTPDEPADPDPQPPEDEDPEDEDSEDPAPDQPAVATDMALHSYATVTGITDGDTFSGKRKPDPKLVAGPTQYRLLGIDTHELDGENADQAQEEKQFVEDWVATGREQSGDDTEWPFIVAYDDPDGNIQGSFGRDLVSLIRRCDGADLADVLIEEFGDSVRYE